MISHPSSHEKLHHDQPLPRSGPYPYLLHSVISSGPGSKEASVSRDQLCSLVLYCIQYRHFQHLRLSLLACVSPWCMTADNKEADHTSIRMFKHLLPTRHPLPPPRHVSAGLPGLIPYSPLFKLNGDWMVADGSTNITRPKFSGKCVPGMVRASSLCPWSHVTHSSCHQTFIG